jgi:hypothetical protein
MQRIVHAPVCAKLGLHVGVAQHAHFRVEFAVYAQDAPVELERWEEGEGVAEAGLGAY